MGEKIAIADHKQQAISTEGRHMPKAFSSPTPVEIAFKKKRETATDRIRYFEF